MLNGNWSEEYYATSKRWELCVEDTVFDNDTSGEGCSGLNRWWNSNVAVSHSRLQDICDDRKYIGQAESNILMREEAWKGCCYKWIFRKREK